MQCHLPRNEWGYYDYSFSQWLGRREACVSGAARYLSAKRYLVWKTVLATVRPDPWRDTTVNDIGINCTSLGFHTIPITGQKKTKGGTIWQIIEEGSFKRAQCSFSLRYIDTVYQYPYSYHSTRATSLLKGDFASQRRHERCLGMHLLAQSTSWNKCW